MSENFEEQFNKLMTGQGLDNLTERLKPENPKEVFIARFRLYGEDDTTLIEEFDTKDERDSWYESFGKWLEMEEGGKIEFDEGPPELKK